MKAVKARELLVRVKNKVGVLADLSSLIAGVSVNIRAISAWEVSDEAFFRLIVSDNAKIKEILTQKGYIVFEEDVVVVELEDKIGQLRLLTDKLKSADIDLIYMYGTTSKPEHEAIMVLCSNDNDKAAEILSIPE